MGGVKTWCANCGNPRAWRDREPCDKCDSTVVEYDDHDWADRDPPDDDDFDDDEDDDGDTDD